MRQGLDHVVTARVSEADVVRLDLAARVSGKTRSAWIREAAVARACEKLESVGPREDGGDR